MLEGDRREGAERRTAKDRPHSFEEQHRPFETDRLGVGAALSRQQEAHRRAHQAQVDHMKDFSHPACEGLSPRQRTSCPLSIREWRVVRVLEQGVELKARGKFQGELGRVLRRQLLCHVAFGRGGGEAGPCPLHLEGVRASMHIDEDGFVLQLEASDPRMVTRLQQLVRDL